MNPIPKARLRRIFEEIAKLALGAGLLGLLWHKGLIDPAAIGSSVAAHPVWMSLAIASQGFLFLCLSMRWIVVALPSRIHIPLELSTRLTLTSHFFSTCLPGNGAGDLVKGWIFSRRGNEFGLVLGTMVLDRMMGMAGLFLTWSLFLSAAIAMRPGSAAMLLPFLAVAIGATLCFLGIIAFSKRIDNWLEKRPDPKPARLAQAMQFLRRTVKPLAKGADAPGSIATALALSVSIQLSYVATVWIAGRILSVPVGVVAAGAVLPLVSLVNALPLSPGGVGLGETVGAAALREFGLAHNAGAQLVLVARFASIFWAIAGSLCYASLRPRKTESDSALER